MHDIYINIAKDFPETPGGRYIKYGPYSGELFRERILIPKIDQAIDDGCKIVLELDGCYGYPISFIDEAFGNLWSHYDPDELEDLFIYKTKEFPTVIQDIERSLGLII